MTVCVVVVSLSLTLHFLGPGGTPHQCLSVWSDLINYFSDLRLKAHVQHTISLVQYLQ